MRQSLLFGTTQREVPRDETSKNAILLLRGGYIRKTMAGVYTFLPLGLRVLRKVSQIVREEMDKLPRAQELLMPALQPKELWVESGRYEEAVADVMYTVDEGKIGLGPTHEEVVTDLFRHVVSSYKDLPVAVYQIQNKFRQEARAKSGLLRGREFLMKDLYSFHISEASLDAFYEEVKAAYYRVFRRAGLQAILTEASGGLFSQYSHEFQVVSPSGEDTIYLNAAGDYAYNQEIVTDEENPELLAFGGGELRKQASIEVGNIFKLKRKFSEPMHAEVTDEDGRRQMVWMGCYGIGISRLMGTMAEVLGGEDKLFWPKEVAPFKIHLIDLTTNKAGEALYEEMCKVSDEVLYDDRQASAGEKFADADLIGAPLRLIVSRRSQDQGGVEVIDIDMDTREVVPMEELIKRFTHAV